MTPVSDAREPRQVQVLYVGAATNRWRCAFHPARPAEAMLRAEALARNTLTPVCSACAAAWARAHEPDTGPPGPTSSRPRTGV